LSGLLLLSFFGVTGYYIYGALKLKELAQLAVESHCDQQGVQLLDGTIFLRSLGVARDNRGNLRLKREFQFEFTVNGGDRNQGWIRLLGRRIISMELAPHRFH
jgi:hypothetical protein